MIFRNCCTRTRGFFAWLGRCPPLSVLRNQSKRQHAVLLLLHCQSGERSNIFVYLRVLVCLCVCNVFIQIRVNRRLADSLKPFTQHLSESE